MKSFALSFRIAFRTAFVACGTLMLGTMGIVTTAFAQGSPAASSSAPATPPPFPLTATITTPGYPGVGPADFKLRVVNLPNGKKMHLLPATLETTQWGWFDNSQAPVLRVNSGDTVVLETMMHSHNQVMSIVVSDYGADLEFRHRLPPLVRGPTP